MTGAAWTLPGYGVERLIGFGSTGEVWRAHELATGDVVALKRLRVGAPALADRAAAERLQREAALLAAIRHPHVLRLRAVLPTAEGMVLVLDYAAGGTLADLLRGRHRLPAGEVVTTAGPVAEALAAAHRQGVVHGDVTPGNVLYTDDGRPLLADLGVGRLIGEVGRPVDGTAGFVDPRVLGGADPSAASDVYGLAAVCFRALTGELAMPRPSAVRGRRSAAVPLRQLAPDAPDALVMAIEAALARAPRARPDAAGFAARLAAAAPAAPVQLTGRPRAEMPARRLGMEAGMDAGPDGSEDQDELLTAAIRPAAAGGLTVAPVAEGGRAARRRSGGQRFRRRSGGWPRTHPGPPSQPAASRAADLQPRPPRRYLIGAVVSVFIGLAVAGGWWWGSATRAAAGHLVAGPAAAVTPVPTIRAAPNPTIRAAPTPTDPTPTPPTPTAVSPPTPAPTPSTPEPGADAQRWQAVLAGLDGRRSAAFAAADPALLTEVYVQGSTPYAADLATLGRLEKAGNRVRVLRHELQEVRVLTSTADRVTLALTDRMPAADVLDASGTVIGSDPGRGAMSWRVMLVSSADGWRIGDLQAA